MGIIIENNITTRKGFLSFVLVMVLSSLIVISLYVYSQSYTPQSYRQALISEKMYYQTLDAKHAVGGFAENGMFLGSGIFFIKLAFHFIECFDLGCDILMGVSYVGTVVTVGAGSPISAFLTIVCTSLDGVKNILDIDTVCDVSGDDLSGEFMDIEPEDDIRRSISLLLFLDEVTVAADQNNNQKVFYYCTDNDRDFEDCSESLVSNYNLIKDNFDLSNASDLFDLAKCKFFILDGDLDPRKLDWTSTCDDNIKVDIVGSGYSSVKRGLSDRGNMTSDKLDLDVNVTFENFGVAIYDMETQSFAVAKIPEKQTFSFVEQFDDDYVNDLGSSAFQIKDIFETYSVDINKTIEGIIK